MAHGCLMLPRTAWFNSELTNLTHDWFESEPHDLIQDSLIWVMKTYPLLDPQGHWASTASIIYTEDGWRPPRGSPILTSSTYVYLVSNCKCMSVWVCIRQAITMSHNLTESHKVSPYLTEYQWISLNHIDSRQISQNLIKSFQISLYLLESRQISLNFIKFHKISQNLTKSHHISLNLIKSKKISLNLPKSHRI